MSSLSVTACGIAVALVAAFACTSASPVGLVGGWQKHNVGDEAIFEELAHYAVSQQVDGREFFDTVLELVDVETQVVAGRNYRLKFKTAESTCRVTESYRREACLPKSREDLRAIQETPSTYLKSWSSVREVQDGEGYLHSSHLRRTLAQAAFRDVIHLRGHRHYKVKVVC